MKVVVVVEAAGMTPLWMFSLTLVRADFIRTRDRFGLRGLVEIHHIIPREFATHPTITRAGYDIEDGHNMMFMPSAAGGHVLQTHRPVHSGGHRTYNRWVGEELNANLNATSPEHVTELRRYLRGCLRSAVKAPVPWKP